MSGLHTPGPWLLVESEVMEDDSVYPPHIVGGSRALEICRLMDMATDAMCESATDIRSKRANARLLAASPTLLEALKTLLDHDERDAGCMPSDAHLDAQNDARAAIAAATSES